MLPSFWFVYDESTWCPAKDFHYLGVHAARVRCISRFALEWFGHHQPLARKNCQSKPRHPSRLQSCPQDHLCRQEDTRHRRANMTGYVAAGRTSSPRLLAIFIAKCSSCCHAGRSSVTVQDRGLLATVKKLQGSPRMECSVREASMQGMLTLNDHLSSASTPLICPFLHSEAAVVILIFSAEALKSPVRYRAKPPCSSSCSPITSESQGTQGLPSKAPLSCLGPLCQSLQRQPYTPRVRP